MGKVFLFSIAHTMGSQFFDWEPTPDKMPSSSIKVNDGQLHYIGEKARNNATKSGNLMVKVNDGSTSKWYCHYFVLHLNLLFEFQNQDASKPINVILLEQCQFERIGLKRFHDSENQVSASCFVYVIPCKLRVCFLYRCYCLSVRMSSRYKCRLNVARRTASK